MRHVMVLNSKGGCGKSTLATNIAVFFARDGHQVCIADYDPQRSSLDWLAQRPADLPAISGVAAYDEGLRNVARNTEILVIDAPARVHGTEVEPFCSISAGSRAPTSSVLISGSAATKRSARSAIGTPDAC